MNAYKDKYLVLFGGIHEITKELNDMFFYDIKGRNWVEFFESDSMKPPRVASSYGLKPVPSTSVMGQTPMSRNPTAGMDMTPPKTQEIKMKKSDVRKIRRTIKSQKSPKKHKSPSRNSKQKLSVTKVDYSAYMLTSPTSISMKNSFIIKNADHSFDVYHTQMKKRKAVQGASFITNGTIETCYGKTRGKKPAARDGHTGIICGDHLIVYGGDRHHMPFNDSFYLDLKNELCLKGHLLQQ